MILSCEVFCKSSSGFLAEVLRSGFAILFVVVTVGARHNRMGKVRRSMHETPSVYSFVCVERISRELVAVPATTFDVNSGQARREGISEKNNRRLELEGYTKRRGQDGTRRHKTAQTMTLIRTYGQICKAPRTHNHQVTSSQGLSEGRARRQKKRTCGHHQADRPQRLQMICTTAGRHQTRTQAMPYARSPRMRRAS